MIRVHTSFPENRSATFPEVTTGFEVVSSMFSDIANSVIAINIDGKTSDLSTAINKDSTVYPIVAESDEGTDIIRHDAAHVMARAIATLFPDTKFSIGPTIENGFYYDFDLSYQLSEKHFEEIERVMRSLIEKDEKFVREVWTRDRAISFFRDTNENYKLEIISAIPENEEITVYKNGDFIDLCRGPHAPSLRYIKAFKLTKISGAYWRANNKNTMLQRIYGTAWPSEEKLKSYLHFLEEAEKRDHRKIGRELEWFHMQNEALGQIFWHKKGWTIYRTVEEYIRKKLRSNGYCEVKTPMMVDKKLWEKSGHWEKFRENMFLVTDEKREIAIKPMNCPCHVQIFNKRVRSYKELPFRIAEFGTCHRNEASGSLYGLMRVRGFTQDDAHIFCTPEQIKDEVLKFYQLLVEVYKDFCFNDIEVKLSDRPENRIGSDDIWDMAEKSLVESMNESKVQYKVNSGEGAFYGPKLEFILKDAIGRDWQCGTIQLDFVLPSRLGAFYTGADGKKHHPVMIHRAILGTLERFIGILIEHHSGNLPMWLSPVQLEILTVNGNMEVIQYAKKLRDLVLEKNFRVELNESEENISHKIRKSIFNKVPLVWVIGNSEVSSASVSVRRYGSSGTCSMEADKALKTLLTYVSIQ